MAPQITLYHFYGSCGLVPHIILNYLGIPFTSALLKPGPNGIGKSFSRGVMRLILATGMIQSLPFLKAQQ